MNKATKPAPTPDELKLRVLQAKAKLGKYVRLKAIYEYSFGSVSEKEFLKIQNCFYLKSADEEITKRIEALADNIRNIPTFTHAA